MFARLRIFIGILALLIACHQGAFAQSDRALGQVASELGYTYAFLGPQSAISIARPGLTVVFRPGDHKFEVNDRVEFAAEAPRFVRDDLVISPAIVDRLRSLASRYPNAVDAVPAAAGTASAQAAPLTGTISLTLTADDSREAVVVSGKAPPSIPITVTITGRISRDIPDVLVSRTSLTSDETGAFKRSITIAPLYFRDAQLTFTASSLGAIRPATGTITIIAPNAKHTMPADNTPKVFY